MDVKFRGLWVDELFWRVIVGMGFLEYGRVLFW